MTCLLQMHPSSFSSLGLVCILDMLSVVCNQSTLTCLCCYFVKGRFAVSLLPLLTGTRFFFLVLRIIFWKAQTPHNLLLAASLLSVVQVCLWGASSTSCLQRHKTEQCVIT